MKRKINLILASFSTIFLCCCHRSEPVDKGLVLIQIQDRNGLSETISNPDRLVAFSKVDFLSSQPYKKVLRVFRSEGKNNSVITTYHPNGTTWQMLEAKEMRAFGSYREWFPNGGKKIEATVIGGNADLALGAESTWLFDKKSSVWNEEGQLLAEIFYDKGVLSGSSIYYYPCAAKEREVPYVQDLIHGEVKEYWPSGDIKSTTIYQNGKKNGPSIAYWPKEDLDNSLFRRSDRISQDVDVLEREANVLYVSDLEKQDNLMKDDRDSKNGVVRVFPNKSISWQEEYVQDRLITGCYFDLSHNKVSEVINGTGYQAIFSDRHLCQLQEIQNGVVEGVVKNFDSSSFLRSIYHMKNGGKHGEEIEYFSSAEIENGSLSTPKITLDWDRGSLHGLVKTWYPNGQMQSQREMCRNKRNGPFCCWYRDGSLMMMEEYENDSLIKGKYFHKNQSDPASTISNGTGTATIYDEEGVFLRKVVYCKGKLVDPE